MEIFFFKMEMGDGVLVPFAQLQFVYPTIQEKEKEKEKKSRVPRSYWMGYWNNKSSAERKQACKKEREKRGCVCACVCVYVCTFLVSKYLRDLLR